MKKIKLCVVVTDSINLWSLYREQFEYLYQKGFDIVAISSNGPEHEFLRKRGIKTKSIRMKKQPSIFFDIYSLSVLVLYFLHNRFDIVCISTPKASLLAGIAARISFQPKVFYSVRGRAYENFIGGKRKFYEYIERLVCAISTRIFIISHELRNDMVKRKICNEEKAFTILKGSSNGVDLNKFKMTKMMETEAKRTRTSLGISGSSFVYLYSGRIRRDKGINELIPAFIRIAEEYNDTYLIILGKEDSIDQINTDTRKAMYGYPKIKYVNWCNDVEKYFASMDVFVFPTYREGFGNVALEAAAMGKPVIGFDVIGVRESVENNVTGILYKDISWRSLYLGMKELRNNEAKRKEYGQNGRMRVEENFASKMIWDELVKEFMKLAGREHIDSTEFGNISEELK